MAIGAFSHIAVSLPVFLTGALAVQISSDLRFGAVGLGAAVATFHGSGALTAIHLGRLVDRLGAIWSLRLAVVGAIATSLGIAFTANSWASFAAWLVLGGMCRSTALPAANRLLVSRVAAGRLGTAFGMKQSAAPAATMLAGLAVPLLAETLGWRSAFAMTAILAGTVMFGVGRRPAKQHRGTKSQISGEPQRIRTGLLLCTLGMAFMAHTSLLGFFVDAAVRAGTTPGLAGSVLAMAGLAAIAVRLAAGIACDRTAVDPFRLSSVMLIVGTCGLGLLATGAPSVMAFGAIVGLAGAWGFPGVFWYAVMRAYPGAPGRVTGALAPGSLGGVIGPIIFGGIVDVASYRLAWLFAAAAAATAATSMLLAGRQIHTIRET